VLDPGSSAVGVATRLNGSREPAETGHRMKMLWITPGGVSKEAESQTGNPDRIGG